MQCEVRIESLGAGGDGIARHEGELVFIPGALPGERVRVELGAPQSGGYHARLLERLNDGPGRAVPGCEYFSACGGCVVQHMAAAPYAAWKQATIRDALAHRGLNDIAVAPLIACPPASRRRARFATSGRRLGFHQRGASEIVDIDHCAVLLPSLAALLIPLRGLVRELASSLPGGVGDISVTQAHDGIDVILHGLDASPGMAQGQHLADFALAHGIARLSVESGAARQRKSQGRKSQGRKSPGRIRGKPRPRPQTGVLEVIAQPGAVRARFGDLAVALPPGAFLQATAAGEAAIARLVRAGLGLEKGGRAYLADLYSGVGGIGFTLAAEGHRVDMFEGDAAMAAAAEAAARGARVAVSATARDLARRPLSPAELKPFDAVIFDPPRAGARAQAETLACSGVARIAAISCHPASFARDARILADGGYRLSALTPIDQFLWSRHVELVAIFERDSG